MNLEKSEFFQKLSQNPKPKKASQILNWIQKTREISKIQPNSLVGEFPGELILSMIRIPTSHAIC